MTCKIIKTNRKSIRLEVQEDALIVRAPWQLSDEKVKEFIAEHQEWIEQARERIRERKETIDDSDLLSWDEINELADKALKAIPERVRYYAEKIGVTYGRITIRNQRSKWGSCSGKGNLNFNCLLMLAPPEVMDSVIVHELCHRKEMNHSDRFYAEVLRVFPDYHKWHAWLKENGAALMKRMGR